MLLTFSRKYSIIVWLRKGKSNLYAGVAELADAPDLGSGVLDVQVQVLSPAPKNADQL